MDAMKRDHKFRTTQVILRWHWDTCSKHNVDERQDEESTRTGFRSGVRQDQESENQSDYL